MSAPGQANTYGKVTPEIAQQLGRIVGEAFVVFDDPDKLEPYSHDETPDRKYAHMPEALVRPDSAEQIAQIMKLANEHRIPVTPRGAGSGLSGGAVPACGGIVLLVDRMNRVLDLDLRNMMITVEPGMVTNEINEVTAEHGLFYAGYPMSLETCYIGGNVAENAGGGKAIKYGVTARYVLGLEVVTPTGQIVQLGGKLIKDVTGYNLMGLMIGSEGTLGIFTKITLKLMPLPKCSVDLLCLFDSPSRAIEAVPKIMTEGGVIPTAIEFMDRSSVQAACEYLNETIAYQDCGAMLLITVDGSDEQQVLREYEAIGEQCLSGGATEVYVADNATTSERLWRIRRNIAEAFALKSSLQCNEDLVVPPAQIPQLVEQLEDIAETYGVFVPAYGHAGDGNLHTRIAAPNDWTREKWQATWPGLLDDLYARVARLGGKLSGEHGIGNKRKAYIDRFLSSEHIQLLRAVKAAWDPKAVLNPGKIFDA